MLTLEQVEWAAKQSWYIGRNCTDIVNGKGQFKVKVLQRSKTHDNVLWFDNFEKLKSWSGYYL